MALGAVVRTDIETRPPTRRARFALAVPFVLGLMLALGAGPAAASTCPTNPSGEAAAGVDWDHCNLEGANLKEANLEKANLEGANLKEAHLEKANLEGANLKEAHVEKANLEGAKATGADLEKANVEGAKAKEADLEVANLNAANLKEADLEGANLNDATLEVVRVTSGFQFVNLEHANLKKANLVGVQMEAVTRGLNLEEADLEGAQLGDLLDANLKNANLKHAEVEEAESCDFEGADLESASLSFGRFEDSNFTGANLKKAFLEFAELQDANLSGAKLEGDNLENANLRDADLDGTHLQEANLEEANLEFAFATGADLEKANLKKAKLENTDLAEANLKGADLEGADLEEAFLQGAELEKANLKNANLKNADLADANLKGAELAGATESSETNWTGATCPGGESSAKHIAGSCLQGLDTTAPTLKSVSLGGTAGKNGWYTSPVAFDWTWSDPDGVLTVTSTNCPESSSTSTEEGEFTFEASAKCEDNAGNASPTFTESKLVKVDTRPPNPPLVTASRKPDYAGGGGWYKDSVEVSFSSGGDPSPGSGVNTASIPATQTFNTSGSHTAEGTEEDNAGNVSQKASLTVQVDATPPTITISCPKSVLLGTPGVTASVTASDGQSGLATPASETVPIDTSTAGARTITRTAVDNVGHETTTSCTTQVTYSQTVTGSVGGGLVVKAKQAVLLAPGAHVNGGVTVEAGGVLDAEGATINGQLSVRKATLLRLCGTTLSGPGAASNSTGKVVIGEGTTGCAPNTITGPLTVTGNSAGVLIIGNTVGGSLTVTANAGGETVTNNKVSGNLTVTGNTGTVVDKPNTVEGNSKIQ